MSSWCELETWKISSLRIHSSIKSQGRCHSLLLNTEGRWWQQVGNWEFVWLTLSEGTVEEATMFHQYCDDCTSSEIYRQEWRDCWQETKSLQQRCVEDALGLERERERETGLWVAVVVPHLELSVIGNVTQRASDTWQHCEPPPDE